MTMPGPTKLIQFFQRKGTGSGRSAVVHGGIELDDVWSVMGPLFQCEFREPDAGIGVQEQTLFEHDCAPWSPMTITNLQSRKEEITGFRKAIQLIQKLNSHHFAAAQRPVRH